MDDSRKWIRIAASPLEIPFNENHLAVADADGKPVCIARFNEKLYAFAAKCPHASGLMHQGFIDAMGNVVCPLHRYRFSMINGRNTSGEGYYLKTWPVEVNEDGVFVGLEKNKLFGLF